MTDSALVPPRTPTRPLVVIAAAVLNFVGAFTAFSAAALSLCFLLLGNVLKLREWAASQIGAIDPALDVATLLGVLSGVFLAIGVLGGVFFLFQGLGLLKGSKVAWYLQLILCVIGLAGFPLGTALNALLLFFLVQKPAREFFKIG